MDTQELRDLLETLEMWAARNSHGHIFGNTAGLLARCGGEAICSHCRVEAEMKKLIGFIQKEIR